LSASGRKIDARDGNGIADHRWTIEELFSLSKLNQRPQPYALGEGALTGLR
jgi:hypothetical protein